MKQKTRPDNKRCAMCAHWTGSRRPLDPWYHEIEFDTSEYATCYGDGNHGSNKRRGDDPACPNWEQRYK